MSENQNKVTFNKNTLVTAISLIVIGILFCAFRSGMISILLTIIGVVLICVGLIQLFNKQYANGAVATAIGIVIIACGWTIVDITLLILGIVAIIYAIYMFAQSANKYKTLKGMNLAAAIMAPLFILIIGILLVAAKWAMADALFIVLGVLAILDGVFMLIKK